MVRIPGSNIDWQEHVHTSGRVFLGNTVTNETRWLWTKWDINGRLFVRNAIDPNKRIWYDEMDFPMRVQTGAATPEDIRRYKSMSAPPVSANPTATAAADHFAPTSSQLRSVNHHGPLTATGFTPPHLRRTAITENASAQHMSPFRSIRATQLQLRSSSRPTAAAPTSFASLRSAPAPQTSLVSPFRAPFARNSRFSHSSPTETVPPTYHLAHDTSPSTTRDDNFRRLSLSARPHAEKLTFSALKSGSQMAPVTRSNFQSMSESRCHGDGATSSQLCEQKSSNATCTSTSRKAPPILPSKRGANASHANKPNSYGFPPHNTSTDTKRTRLVHDDAHGTAHTNQRYPDLSFAFCDERRLPRSARRLRTGALALRLDLVTAQTSARGRKPLRTTRPSVSVDDDGVLPLDPIVGTNTNVEKDYLRLTSAPKPSAVRPPNILRIAVAHIKKCWADGSRNYDWVCRQLKSVRQDYKVQAVQDVHVIDTYETHARIALENNDLGEFNTCVAQVRDLYSALSAGSFHAQDEFTAYRILYNLITNAKAWEQSRVIGLLSREERKRPATQFAIDVLHAVVLGNYHRYSRLNMNLPPHTMVSFLLGHLSDRMRYHGLRAMVAAYAPGQRALIPLRFVLTEVGLAPGDGAKEDGKDEQPVLAERILSAEDRESLTFLEEVGLVREVPWIIRGAALLVKLNMVLFTDQRAVNSPADTVFIDCKATKSAGGVRKLKSARELITYAGSVFRR